VFISIFFVIYTHYIWIYNFFNLDKLALWSCVGYTSQNITEFATCKISFMEYLKFSLYRIRLFANRNNLVSSLHVQFPFSYYYLMIALAKISCSVLNKSGKKICVNQVSIMVKIVCYNQIIKNYYLAHCLEGFSL
jgi:hypothetical protein